MLDACFDKTQVMQVTSWCFTKAIMNLGMKYDTNIMTISLEKVKTNAAVRETNFYNSFSSGRVVSFIFLLLTALQRICASTLLQTGNLTKTHSTNTRKAYKATATHKAVF